MMSIIAKLRSVKDRRAPKKVTVKSAHNVTPNMRRVSLHGESLSNLPTDSEGAYIKLLFQLSGQYRPAMRTYTISQQRSENNE